MQYHWLNKNNNENLIIFFSGWSFDYRALSFLKAEDFDVLCVYDYTEISPFEHQFPNYKFVNLIAWSMGVFAAWSVRKSLPGLSKKIAINGTPCPIEDKFGIPEKIFKMTLDNLNLSVLEKFRKNMFSNEEEYGNFIKNTPCPDFENSKQELINLEQTIKASKETYSDFYDYAIISGRDKIFPYKNQLRFWEERAKIIKLDCGHFPFGQFKSWNDILNNADQHGNN